MPNSVSRFCAVGGKGGGLSRRAASTSISSQAASVSDQPRMNSSLSSPAGIGFRKRALIVPGIAHEFAARPVEAGDMGDRHDRQAKLRIELDDAVFVGRLVARARGACLRDR